MNSKVNSRFQIIPVNFKSCYEWLIIYENIFDKLTGQFWTGNLHQSLIHFKHDYANLLNMPTVVFSFPQQIVCFTSTIFYLVNSNSIKGIVLAAFPLQLYLNSCWRKFNLQAHDVLFSFTFHNIFHLAVHFYSQFLIHAQSAKWTTSPSHLGSIYKIHNKFITIQIKLL
jgi:hypothetical protein